MIQNCPVCGKGFDIMWPHLWAYKRTGNYYCSWKCLRTMDKEKEERPIMPRGTTRLGKPQNEEAIRIALSGGSPLKYLEDCGSKNPSAAWYNIKQKIKENDPETYEKLPKKIQRKDAKPTLADAMTVMKDAADQFFGQCEDMGLKLDKPEEPKITKPVNYDGFNVRAVEGDYGSYHFQEINGKQWLDFDDKECANEMSMTVEQWRGFLAEIRKAALILGVEL